MDNSIFNIDAWQANTNYFQHKIVTSNNLYYYAARNYTSDSTSINNDINNGNLVGYIYDRGVQKPYFSWKHSYGASNKNEPKIRTISFEGGWTQRYPDGINNLLLNFDLKFDARDIHETTAILHFLAARNGSESFCWVCPAPRSQLLRFVCQNWQDSQPFYNNYSITANFVQSPV